MDGNRCPECENDLSEPLTAAVIGLISARRSGPTVMVCPHCGTELSVTANVTASLSRQN